MSEYIDLIREAMERAAGDLPDGWQIRLCVELGAGWVELIDPDGETYQPNHTDEAFADQVHELINYARDNVESFMPNPDNGGAD